MMRAIHLHGSLKKEFGPSFRFDVATAGEALRALNCAFPGKFVAALREGSFKLVRGAHRTGINLARGTDLSLINELNLGMADLHLIPVAKGAVSGKGVAKTVLGAVLIGGAIFMSGGTLAAPIGALSGVPLIGGLTYGNIALLGLGMTLSGASTLLAKPASTIDNDADQSRMFSGISGNANQGDAIPVIYGETLVPGIPISFDMLIEDTFVYNGDGVAAFTGSIPDGTGVGKPA
jgi:predicted phage tail protein